MCILFTVLHMFLTVLFERICPNIKIFSQCWSFHSFFLPAPLIWQYYCWDKSDVGHHCTLLVCPPHQLALPGSSLSRLQARRQEKCGKTDPQRSSIWPSLDQVTTSAQEERTHRVCKHKEHISVQPASQSNLVSVSNVCEAAPSPPDSTNYRKCVSL